MNNGRDCKHGRRVGCCDSCDLAVAEKRILQLEAENKLLIERVSKIPEIVAAASIEGFTAGFNSHKEISGKFHLKIEQRAE